VTKFSSQGADGDDGGAARRRRKRRAPEPPAVPRVPKSKRHGVGGRADLLYDPVTGRKLPRKPS
jgi:hypothetical protein